ncbi:MAG: hypothetical protein U9N52_10740, partial [Campylobacterota bacterium]|nr:hypothetical protein [Campylobacterota bacterium]
MKKGAETFLVTRPLSLNTRDASITHCGKSTFTFLVSILRALGLVAFEKPRYSLMSSFHTLLYDTITIMKTFFLFIFIILLFQG